MTAETDLERVRGLVGAALASLEASRSRIDDLNVYPVPDGDTGTNLTLTVRAVADVVSRHEDASSACTAVLDLAGDETRTDDVTAVVVRRLAAP